MEALASKLNEEIEFEGLVEAGKSIQWNDFSSENHLERWNNLTLAHPYKKQLVCVFAFFSMLAYENCKELLFLFASEQLFSK